MYGEYGLGLRVIEFKGYADVCRVWCLKKAAIPQLAGPRFPKSHTSRHGDGTSV